METIKTITITKIDLNGNVLWSKKYNGDYNSNELSEIESIKNIDVIDIDKDLKEISEKYFLQKKLSEKINFYPQSARFFLNNL